MSGMKLFSRQGGLGSSDEAAEALPQRAGHGAVLEWMSVAYC